MVNATIKCMKVLLFGINAIIGVLDSGIKEIYNNTFYGTKLKANNSTDEIGHRRHIFEHYTTICSGDTKPYK